jgi:hypothetical protein
MCADSNASSGNEAARLSDFRLRRSLITNLFENYNDLARFIRG